MIRGVLTIVLWLCAGHALAAALFYGLVTTPDSNAFMLLASAVLAFAILFVAGLTNVTAVQWLQPEGRFRQALRLGVSRGFPAILVGVVLYAAASYGVGHLREWYQAHMGELDAWWMATFDSARTSAVHRTIDAALYVLRDVIGLSLALAAFCALALHGLAGLAPGGWLRHAFSRMQLGMVALAGILLIGLPWRATGWRPSGLPATWVEVAFAVAKLGLIYLIAHLGWALMLAAATRAAGRDRVSRRWEA